MSYLYYDCKTILTHIGTYLGIAKLKCNYNVVDIHFWQIKIA